MRSRPQHLPKCPPLDDGGLPANCWHKGASVEEVVGTALQPTPEVLSLVKKRPGQTLCSPQSQ